MTVFMWHGAAMAFAWLVLLPLGTLVARFGKVRRRQDYPRQLDDTVWWNLHRGLQGGGAALAAWAFWTVYVAMGRTVDWTVPHVWLGAAVLSVCAVQLVGSLYRGTKGGPTDEFAHPEDPLTWRGDHYDMTLRRRVWEWAHKGLGYGCIAVAVVAVWTGIEAAGLEDWWKLGVLGACAAYAAAFLWHTWNGRRVDTWLAIWGPDGR